MTLSSSNSLHQGLDPLPAQASVAVADRSSVAPQWNLGGTNLSGADLSQSDLRAAQLIETDLSDAALTGSSVYGVSVWNIRVNDRTKQQDLIITDLSESAITVDNIKVAQFIQLAPSIRSSERCSWSDQRNDRSPIPLVAISLLFLDPDDRRRLDWDSFQ
jgi:uncharacterized protein YjbI with pentapeptide repeats